MIIKTIDEQIQDMLFTYDFEPETDTDDIGNRALMKMMSLVGDNGVLVTVGSPSGLELSYIGNNGVRKRFRFDNGVVTVTQQFADK